MPGATPARQFELRQLTASDALAEPAIHFLWNILDGRNATAAAIEEVYANNLVYAVVEPVDALAGAIVFDAQRWRPRRQTETYIHYLATAQSARHRGYGRLLVATAIERGLQAGDTHVALHASEEETTAIAFYSHLGFRATEPHATGGLLLMELEITPAVLADLRQA